MKYDRGWDVWGIYTGPGSGRSVAECSETSTISTQMPGKHPKENILQEIYPFSKNIQIGSGTHSAGTQRTGDSRPGVKVDRI
jgi:hypothetical protein